MGCCSKTLKVVKNPCFRLFVVSFAAFFVVVQIVLAAVGIYRFVDSVGDLTTTDDYCSSDANSAELCYKNLSQPTNVECFETSIIEIVKRDDNSGLYAILLVMILLDLIGACMFWTRMLCSFRDLATKKIPCMQHRKSLFAHRICSSACLFLDVIIVAFSITLTVIVISVVISDSIKEDDFEVTRELFTADGDAIDLGNCTTTTSTSDCSEIVAYILYTPEGGVGARTIVDKESCELRNEFREEIEDDAHTTAYLGIPMIIVCIFIFLIHVGLLCTSHHNPICPKKNPWCPWEEDD
eukprot:TRINITY_DN19805_c0_g1_i1.p1 TRINITY_DN19805_c0_g1~~TRINITY_DN19805_c0_g1_i1.p1  ORF type:complete len:296 (-),score=11.52 TRINITY_DN19805_c0_g1_i1:22-909(-)